ncbi:MAG: hypothetical protein ACREJT_03355, partial [Myxococcota bacterium]
MLVQDFARAHVPGSTFVKAARERAELGHRAAGVHMDAAEIGFDGFDAEVPLKNVREVGAPQHPQDLYRPADQTGVAVDASAGSLDCGHQRSDFAHRVILAARGGEGDRRVAAG